MLHPLIGQSRDIEHIRDIIHHTAGMGLHTVVYGESGVGKEVVVQNLHQSSPRRGNPLVKVNCAALPDSLLDSELFGHEKGSFTGAVKRQRGKFEVAHGGVLFLDEIGEMSSKLQTRFLHVLEGGKFTPLGSEEEICTDTWIITATNSCLEEKVKSGTFREDLYYRLNIIRIPIRPLRERPEDIPPLIDYYLSLYLSGTKKRNNHRLNKKNLKKLMAYPWPGNVRELQSVLRRFTLTGNWDVVVGELPVQQERKSDITHGLPSFIAPIIDEILNVGHAASPASDTLSLKEITSEALAKIEREVIRHTLLKTGWNRRRASKILDIAYYTLNRKISDLTITPPRYLQ